jgi:hypothetical protein
LSPGKSSSLSLAKECMRKLTTITGPQAEALMWSAGKGSAWTYVNKSVPGESILDIYVGFRDEYGNGWPNCACQEPEYLDENDEDEE